MNIRMDGCVPCVDSARPGRMLRRTSRGAIRSLAHSSRLATLAIALSLAAPLASFAQGNAVPARITAQINESSLTTLRGNTHPMARPQFDQGAVADSQPMRRMLLLLQRSPQQEAALRAVIDGQQSKASPNYHQWLTPQQFGQQYGPSSADIQTVTGWLQSHGFQIARVSTGGTLVEFSGTAGQVRNAFHTEIHRYLVDGETHFANNTDPRIPAALAPVVAGPVSLHNFPKKAQNHNMGVFKKDLNTGKVVPEFSFGCTNVFGAAATCNALSPGDFAKIYNVQTLWNAGIDGTGQTIAIVGDSEICTASSPVFASQCTVDDTAAFRGLFGLPTTNLPTVILDGPDPGFNGDELEGNLDVQWSGAVAKGATIDFVIAANTEATAGTDLAAEYVVDNNLAPVLSESFGACEFGLGNNGNQYEATLWEQAAAQGITVIVSSGDSGAAGCDNPNFPAPNPAQNGVNVNGIASTAFNVAAGGTDFDITLPTPGTYQSTYWGPNATVSGNKSESVLSYVPETTWNDSCAQNFTGAATGCNSPSSTAAVNIVGGGGGQSNCVTANNLNQCTAYYPKPAWQTVATGSGFTVATDITRDLPDVSLFAADGFVSNSFYAICDLNFSTGPCSTTSGSVDIVGVGGTSAAAPSFAGMMALVNQKMTTLHTTNSQIPTRQGNPNYVLYTLAKNQAALSCNSSSSPVAGCTFNDVTKGNISTPCMLLTLNCSNPGNSALYGELEELNTLGNPNGVLAFTAGTGLDLATGLGSVNAGNLVNNWAAVVGAFTPTTTTLCMSTTATTLSNCTLAAINITHGSTVWVNIGVTPSPGTGTNAKAEDVSLIGTLPGGATAGVDLFTSNNYVLSNADIYSLTNGSVSGVATTAALQGGSYTVIAHYAGDGTFGASNSTSPITVTVNPEASTTALSTLIYNFNTGNGTSSTQAYYGDAIYVRADVKGSASAQESATGTVTITDSAGGLGAFKLNTEGYAEDQTGAYISGVFTPPLTVGPHSFTASFGGDPSYKLSSTASALAFTVLQAPTTSVVTPSATTVVANTPFSLSVFVDTQSGSALSSGGSSGAAPTGTVTFKAGTTILGTANVSGATDSLAYVAAQATLSNVTLASTATITAVYNGDANYSASPASTGVTVTVTTPSVTTTSLPTGVIHVAYPTTTLAASGGAAPYTWSLTMGSLPTGLALSTAGVITGTPTVAGTAHFTVQVKDSVNNTNTAMLSITVNASLQVTTITVPTDVNAGVAYPNTTLAATGGTSQYTDWVVSSGALPPGLTLSNAGVISGTPTASSVTTSNGTYTFMVKVTDSAGGTATSGNLTIGVSGFTYTAASTSPITIASQGLSGTQLITLNTNANGFAGTATLSASVTSSPSGAIDTPVLTFTTPDSNFNTANNTMTFTNSVTTGNVTLNVATTAMSSTFHQPNGNSPSRRIEPLTAVAIATLLAFLMLLAAQKQRRWGLVSLIVLLAVVAFAGVSCGSSGGGGGGGNPTGTTPGNYTITVVATPAPGGAQAAQTATISVTVQ